MSAALWPHLMIPPQDITSFHNSRKALTIWLMKSNGPAFGRAVAWN
jgi:hypothetical protein